jgi:hypothetical protein
VGRQKSSSVILAECSTRLARKTITKQKSESLAFHGINLKSVVGITSVQFGVDVLVQKLGVFANQPISRAIKLQDVYVSLSLGLGWLSWAAIFGEEIVRLTCSFRFVT